MQTMSIKDKLAQLGEYWKPRIIGQLNGQLVKIVKLQGEFVWHHHEKEDELFWVIQGNLEIHTRDPSGRIEVHRLGAGEFLIVPRGTEHKPVAPEEVHLVLFEPESTRNTGNVADDRTIEPEQLDRG